jgi:hypothetical protein
MFTVSYNNMNRFLAHGGVFFQKYKPADPQNIKGDDNGSRRGRNVVVRFVETHVDC